MRRYWPLTVLLGGLLLSCQEDDPVLNRPPETTLAVDTIALTGEARLNSVVTLNWFGTDVDGFVTGYEVSTDGGLSWAFVTRQDSTFRFSLEGGADSADVAVQVRAIDNEDATDPTPARLAVPIRNTPPTAAFVLREYGNDQTVLVPENTLPVFSVEFEADDLDGPQSLDSLFVRLNDGPWYPLAPNERFLTFQAANPTASGPTAATVFEGFGAEARADPIVGLVIGDSNRVYLQARDIAGALSVIDTSDAFLVRAQTSDLLLVDVNSATSVGGAEGPDEFYTATLAEVYAPGYDYLDLGFDQGRYQPKYWDPTFTKLLELYDKLFWYSNGVAYNNAAIGRNQLTIEAAAQALQNFLDRGGKWFFTGALPAYVAEPDPISADLNPSSRIFDITPMDSLSSSEGSARLPNGALIAPTVAGFDTLQGPGRLLSSQDPFYPKPSAEVVYTAELSPRGGWTGPNVVGARRFFANGEPNQYFFTIELYLMEGRPAARRDLIDRVLNEEFNW